MSTKPSSQAFSPSYGRQQGIYEYLSRTSPEIRVIEILPGPDDQPVHCELHKQLLISNFRYAALSYVWGNPKITKDIIVNGQPFSATTNLASALWYLRKYGFPKNEQTGEIHWLWIDAVCINQNDIPETSHQVSMMGSIYRGASSVLSWLGPPEPYHLDQALEAIREVGPVLGATPEYSSLHTGNRLNHDLAGAFKRVDISPTQRLHILLYERLHVPKRGSDEVLEVVFRAIRDLEEGQSFEQSMLRLLNLFQYDNESFTDEPKHTPEMMMAAFEKLNDKLGPLVRLPDYPQSIDKESEFPDNKRWLPISLLGYSNYWSRIWIIQEMVLAKSPWTNWFICGKASVNFRELEAFISFFTYIKSMPCPEDQYGQQTAEGVSWRLLALSNFGLPSLHIVRGFQKFVSTGAITLFAAACFTASQSEATDPRDLVYAVLSLVPNDITPDYNKSIHDVYLEAVGRGDELRKNVSGCLQYAGRGYGIESQHKLPSWLADLTIIYRSRTFIDYRNEKESLLDTIGTQQPEIIGLDVLRIQGAVCGRVKLAKQLDFTPDPFHNVKALIKLSVDYLVEFVGARVATHQMADEGKRPLQELMDVLDWETKDSRRKYAKIRDMSGRCFSGFCMSSVQWQFLFNLWSGLGMTDADNEEALTRLELPTDSSLGRMLGHYFEDMRQCSSDPEEPIERGIGREQLLKEFTDMLKSCINRTLFQTDDGRLGIGLLNLQQGDLICAVDSSSLPILLRRVESLDSDGSHLEHVGACYVLGLSDGEPADMVKKGELELETFEIH